MSGYGNNDVNTMAQRDAYSSNHDPYRTYDPYKTNDPYNRRNPYENEYKDGNKREKVVSRYGWGLYCDRFFELENFFRSKFSDDTQLHEEKRDYVGSGDMASIIPQIFSLVGSSFTLNTLLLFLFTIISVVANSFYLFLGLSAIYLIFFIWRFGCPAYIITKTKQYIIGNEYKAYHKGFENGIKMLEMMNVFIVGILFVFISSFKNLFIYVYQESLDYLAKNAWIFNEFFYKLSKNHDIAIEYIWYFTLLYAFATVVYFVYIHFFFEIKINKRREENLKSIKMKRMSNQYQRKSFILDGELEEEEYEF